MTVTTLYGTPSKILGASSPVASMGSDDGVQTVVGHLYGVRGVSGDVPVLGDHGGDGLPVISHSPPSEDGMARNPVVENPRPDRDDARRVRCLDVLPRVDAKDAVHRPCLLRIDPLDGRVSVSAPNEGEMGPVRRLHAVRVRRSPGHEGWVLPPFDVPPPTDRPVFSLMMLLAITRRRS